MIASEKNHCIYVFSCIHNWQIESMFWISRGWLILECSCPMYMASESSGTMRSTVLVRHLMVVCWLCGLTKNDQNASQVRPCTLLSCSSMVAKSYFHWFSNIFAFGSFRREQLEIKLTPYKLSFNSSITLFIISLALEVALSTFINYISHSENNTSLCVPWIFSRLAALPSTVLCHLRKFVTLSSTSSNSNLVLIAWSISDVVMMHNGSTSDILWQRRLSCCNKALFSSRASFLNSFTLG